MNVCSIGDAKSLQGGTLLMTHLRGADGEVYAVAQGPVTLGGFAAGGASGSTVGKNHTTAGFIANGAFVERELKYDFEQNRTLTVNLYQPDFTTSMRLASLINSRVGDVEAKLVDRAPSWFVEGWYHGSVVGIISLIENLDVPVDSVAVVVMNEKTGDSGHGRERKDFDVAVAHGNLSIEIKEEKKVSRPCRLPGPPLRRSAAAGNRSKPKCHHGSGGQTVVTPESQVTAIEEKKRMMLLPQGVTIQVWSGPQCHRASPETDHDPANHRRRGSPGGPEDNIRADRTGPDG